MFTHRGSGGYPTEEPGQSPKAPKYPGGSPFKQAVLDAGWSVASHLVLLDPQLTPTAKILFITLCAFSWDKDRVWPSQDRLAVCLGVSVRQVQRLLIELEKNRLIRTIPGGVNKPNTYDLSPFVSKYTEADVESGWNKLFGQWDDKDVVSDTTSDDE